ncbi:MAG: DUF4230 domain-containing protein [Bulleidia sp.]
MNVLKKMKPSWLFPLITAVMVFLTAISVYFRLKANDFGTMVGNMNGQIVGIALGSFKGVTEGLDDGYRDGKEKALSAEDTEVRIGNVMHSIGKLEVLSASVTLTNVNEVGDTYGSLERIGGNVVFTVDLNQIEINFSNDNQSVYVSIPYPECEIYIDQQTTEVLAEYQKFSWTVKAEEGLKEYINSMKELVEKARENISNYDTLQQQAESAAIEQVKNVVQEVCLNKKTVNIQFQ